MEFWARRRTFPSPPTSTQPAEFHILRTEEQKRGVQEEESSLKENGEWTIQESTFLSVFFAYTISEEDDDDDWWE